MAWQGAGCSAYRGARGHDDGAEPGRPSGYRRWQSLAAHDNGLFAEGQEYGRCGSRVSGGGYWVLYMDLEGTEVCDWLTSKGITCVLLKYRVPGEHLSPRSGAYPKSPVALEDAQRTLGLVR